MTESELSKESAPVCCAWMPEANCVSLPMWKEDAHGVFGPGDHLVQCSDSVPSSFHLSVSLCS